MQIKSLAQKIGQIKEEYADIKPMILPPVEYARVSATEFVYGDFVIFGFM
jgi:hypothetical protein